MFSTDRRFASGRRSCMHRISKSRTTGMANLAKAAERFLLRMSATSHDAGQKVVVGGLGRTAFIDDAPFIEHDDPVADSHGLFNIAGCQQYRSALLRDLADDLVDF